MKKLKVIIILLFCNWLTQLHAQEISSMLTERTTEILKEGEVKSFNWKDVKYNNLFSRVNLFTVKKVVDLSMIQGMVCTYSIYPSGAIAGDIHCEALPPLGSYGPNSGSGTTGGGSSSSGGVGGGVSFSPPSPPSYIGNLGNPGNNLQQTGGGGIKGNYINISQHPPEIKLSPDKRINKYLEDTLKNKFIDLVNKNKLEDAFKLVVKGCKFDTTNFSFKIDSTVKSPIMVTNGANEVDSLQTIMVPKILFEYVANDELDWAQFLRGVGHEFEHIKQKSMIPIFTDHNEREFLAYVYTIANTTLPPLLTEDKEFFKNSLKKYYSKLDLLKQQQYSLLFTQTLKK